MNINLLTNLPDIPEESKSSQKQEDQLKFQEVKNDNDSHEQDEITSQSKLEDIVSLSYDTAVSPQFKPDNETSNNFKEETQDKIEISYESKTDDNKEKAIIYTDDVIENSRKILSYGLFKSGDSYFNSLMVN